MHFTAIFYAWEQSQNIDHNLLRPGYNHHAQHNINKHPVSQQQQHAEMSKAITLNSIPKVVMPPNSWSRLQDCMPCAARGQDLAGRPNAGHQGASSRWLLCPCAGPCSHTSTCCCCCCCSTCNSHTADAATSAGKLLCC